MGGEDGKGANGWTMSELRVPLQIFGPKALHRWLFHEWESLEDISKNALRLLHAQTARSGTIFEERLVELATAFEYERMLAALTDEDFKQFIDWALDAEQGEPWPANWSRPIIPLSLSDLDMEYQELRQLLLLTFARERIWPRQGFRPLIQEALDAANQAMDELAFADPNMSLLKRWEAIRHVHDGLDRALLCTERFLDLLLEFLALLVLHLGWASLDEAAEWFAAIGVTIPGQFDGRLASWHRKQRILAAEIGVKFWEDLEAERFQPAPVGWESLWSNVHLLVSSCGFEQGDRGWYPTGDLMIILDSLRDSRNIVRHAPSTLQESERIPEAYIEATPQIRNKLQELWQRLVDPEAAFPQTAKVLECSNDCYGGINFTLALETRRVVTARYVHDVDKDRLASQAEENPALAQVEYEFFLLPSPRPEQHLLINPLLLRRDYAYQELGDVGIREETLADIKAMAEGVKVVLAEEAAV